MVMIKTNNQHCNKNHNINTKELSFNINEILTFENTKLTLVDRSKI